MQMRQKFEAAGGNILERTVAQGVRVHPNGVALQLQADHQDVTGQLLIDCMGNFSPIVRQVAQPHLQSNSSDMDLFVTGWIIRTLTHWHAPFTVALLHYPDMYISRA